MTTADVIRILLLLDILGMGLLGIYSLSRRQMNWTEYIAWGVFAVMIPVFGPFLVIALRPGIRRNS